MTVDGGVATAAAFAVGAMPGAAGRGPVPRARRFADRRRQRNCDADIEAGQHALHEDESSWRAGRVTRLAEQVCIGPALAERGTGGVSTVDRNDQVNDRGICARNGHGAERGESNGPDQTR